MKKFVLIFLTAFVFTQTSLAQTSPETVVSFRRGLATVMLSSLGGAVLGLSTLSFYGNPQDHIGNIWTGLALGAAGGVIYSFSQTQRNSMALDPFPEEAKMKMAQQGPSLLQYNFEF